MILVTQLAGIVQSNVASLAGDRRRRRSPCCSIAWLIFMLPHSIVTVSIATAYFTRMSGHARDGDSRRVRADLSASLRTIGLLITGAGAALAAAALPFAAVLRQRPRARSWASARVLLAYLIGLVPFSALFVVQRAFYALGDTRTPFFIQLAAGRRCSSIGALVGRRCCPRAHRRRGSRSSPRSPAPCRRVVGRSCCAAGSAASTAAGCCAGSAICTSLAADPGARRSASAVLALLGGFAPADSPISGPVPARSSRSRSSAASSWRVYVGRARRWPACPSCAGSAPLLGAATSR